LLTEDIFPHGYGDCPSHSLQTMVLWDQKRRLLSPNIEAGTDVAAEMSAVAQELQHCRICHKACIAAVEMLAYKCRKIPTRIDRLSTSD